MGVHGVIFDIGGVLETTQPMTFASDWEQKLGLDAGAIFGRLADMWLAANVGEVTEAELHQAISQRLDLSPAHVENIVSDMWEQYLGVANDELIAYLSRLRPRYRTGLLSNSAVGAREREQAAYGFENLVDDIVYSHEVGIEKPDPRIYELACTRLGVAATEVVFVDDADIAIAGAEAVGFTTIKHVSNAETIAALDTLLS